MFQKRKKEIGTVILIFIFKGLGVRELKEESLGDNVHLFHSNTMILAINTGSAWKFYSL